MHSFLLVCLFLVFQIKVIFIFARPKFKAYAVPWHFHGQTIPSLMQSFVKYYFKITSWSFIVGNYFNVYLYLLMVLFNFSTSRCSFVLQKKAYSSTGHVVLHSCITVHVIEGHNLHRFYPNSPENTNLKLNFSARRSVYFMSFIDVSYNFLSNFTMQRMGKTELVASLLRKMGCLLFVSRAREREGVGVESFLSSYYLSLFGSFSLRLRFSR